MIILKYLGSLSKAALIISGVVFTILLGFIDYLTGPDLSFIIFYLIPIALVTWFAGKWPGIFISIVSAITWIVSDIMVKSSYSHFLIPYWNMVVEFSVFLLVVYIFSTLKIVLAREKELNMKLKQNIQQITDLNKELETFNYSVSHDLRTPLIVIGGFAKRLLKKYSGNLDDKWREELNIIQENVQRMSRLIDDLLAFSRSERQQIKFEVVDMNKLARNVVEELKVLTSEKTLIDVKDIPSVYGDSIMLHQVLYNLISNAIKFTKHKETVIIEIGCKIEKDEYIYYVKDNGAGFDMKYADKLFGVFQRLHKSEEFEGTGIGLAIVQRIVKRHGGRVWAEGKADEGATFYFSLPKLAFSDQQLA
ncbi:MAG: GHKL domain-containing protein [Nitrospirae bacterium]|nr:GHKL domain-containing protein [Nitrospirota bacterium]